MALIAKKERYRQEFLTDEQNEILLKVFEKYLTYPNVWFRMSKTSIQIDGDLSLVDLQVLTEAFKQVTEVN